MRPLPRYAPVLLLLTSCQVGTTAQNYPPARGPAGAMVTLQLEDKSKISGELLAVEDSTLLVLQNREILRIRLSAVRRGSAAKVWFYGASMKADLRDRLRLISRFPQGVSAELEPRLTDAYGQAEIRRVP